ncbi:MAG: hypothetical protein RMJ97_08325 [Raineya sp.]|nr:hypothetical protein [Raineya sp.]MDW8296875.1 hypothetical protein [Raineya sp.]
MRSKSWAIRYVLILSLSLAILLAIDEFFLKHLLFHKYKWYLLLFFASQSILTTYIVSKGMGKDIKVFQNYFFASMLLRMLLSIGAFFYFVYQGVTHLLWFVGTFFVLYFSFVGFEIYGLLHNLRAKTQQRH